MGLYSSKHCGERMPSPALNRSFSTQPSSKNKGMLEDAGLQPGELLAGLAKLAWRGSRSVHLQHTLAKLAAIRALHHEVTPWGTKL